ncbi:hypothetical protein ACFE33_12305 [Falsihalocynthiibacter sp. SS001]|uniref:hypothetical protein n=1 Tax=Falsihalocynthiibacter sp. SS001 TaxID=3349698 RepID=UPI0036D2149A
MSDLSANAMAKPKQNTYVLFSYFLLAIVGAKALVTAYTYARFTVDDAFITWRYGRNLVEFGLGLQPDFV